MRNTGLDEAQSRIKMSGENINNLRYADDTTLMAESAEELKSLLIKVKEESGKSWLKTQHSEDKDHGIWYHQFSSVQWLSRVRLFSTPWTAACQASLPITNSWCPPKPMSIVSVMPSNHLILCCPLLLLPSMFPVSGSFQMSQLSATGGQSIGVSASTSVPPMYIQDWSSLGGTGWISLLSKGLSRVFLNTTDQTHWFFDTQLYSPTLTSIHDYWKNLD